MFISSHLKLELFKWINWTCWQTEILTELLISSLSWWILTSSPDPKPIRDLWPTNKPFHPSSPSARPPASVWALSLRLNCQSPAAVVPPQAAKPISVSDSRPQSFSSTFQTLFVIPVTTKQSCPLTRLSRSGEETLQDTSMLLSFVRPRIVRVRSC